MIIHQRITHVPSGLHVDVDQSLGGFRDWSRRRKSMMIRLLSKLMAPPSSFGLHDYKITADEQQIFTEFDRKYVAARDVRSLVKELPDR